MSFKKYLENGMPPLPSGTVDMRPPHFIPPEGHPTGGPKIIQKSIDFELWENIPKDGVDYLVLNEKVLKEVLQEHGIIIKDGILNYDKVNKRISFGVADAVGGMSIDQFSFLDKLLWDIEFILKVIIEPENSRVTIYLNPDYEVGGLPDGV